MPANNEDVKGQLPSIYRGADKEYSPKPTFIHSHRYTVPGRRQAGLISELPRRVLLGNRASARVKANFFFYWRPNLSFTLSITPLPSSPSLANFSTVSTETSIATNGSSPTTQPSCPGSITYASPGPRSVSVRSSITSFS